MTISCRLDNSIFCGATLIRLSATAKHYRIRRCLSWRCLKTKRKKVKKYYKMMLEATDVDTREMTLLKSAKNFYSCSLQEPVKLRGCNDNLGERKLKTIPQLFRESCEKYKDLPALAYETKEEDRDNEGNWTTVTYAEYEKHVEQAALLLLHLGVKPRSSVAVWAFNCPEWFYIELGALRIGAVVTGIYTNSTAEAACHILATSESSVCLVDDVKKMSNIRAMKSHLNHLKSVIQLNGPFEEFVGEQQGYYRWNDLFNKEFSLALRAQLLLSEHNVAANECALLIFTPGTVGMPKGVMLSHENILSCSHAFRKFLSTTNNKQEINVTYLPLSHVQAQIFDIFVGLENGFLIYFADRDALKGSLTKTYDEANATILAGMPLVYQTIKEKVVQLEKNSFKLFRVIMQTARFVVETYHLDKMAKKKISQLKYWFASKVVDIMKTALGLSDVKLVIMGGEPATEETKRFLLSLDLPVTEVYGMSETAGPITFNDGINLESVGKPLKGVEIQINQPNERGEGEILVRGHGNLMGYLKDPKKTMKTLTEDGWLRTGDIGYLDEQENLNIVGRLKELITTAEGENIPAMHIEHLIKEELPCVSNAVIIGNNRKYLTLLLTLKTDIDRDSGYPLDTLAPETMQWLSSFDVYYTHLSDLLGIKMPPYLQNFDPNSVVINYDPQVWQALEAGIKRYNNQAVINAHKIQHFTVLPHDFSIPTNELSPILKIKRTVVEKKYKKLIDKMYEKYL